MAISEDDALWMPTGSSPDELHIVELIDWLTELRFYVPPDTKYVILETFFSANLLA